MNAQTTLPRPNQARAIASTSVLRDHYLRIGAVMLVTGLGRSTIYRMIEAGDFPKQEKLTRKAVGWSRIELDQWLADPTNWASRTAS